MLSGDMEIPLRFRKVANVMRVARREGPRAAFRLARRKFIHRWLAPELALLAAPERARLSTQLAETRRQLAALERQQRNSNDSIRQLASLLAHAAAVPGAAPSIKITVIMPVYNRSTLARVAIRSVLTQTGAAFELIVANDGSTDGFCQAEAPELADPRVRLLALSHAGAPAARNRALALATGEVIVYLDSDNTMYPGYLHAVASAFAAAPGAGSAYAALLWDDGAACVHLRHDDFFWPDLYADRINLDLNCFSHRRSLFRELGGFDETLTKHADFDLTLRYTRESPPLRIHAVAARYYAGQAFPRMSGTQASAPNFARILAKHRPAPPSGLKILLYCSDYPQLSESYVDTEIAFLLERGHRVEVFQRLLPGAPGQAQVPVHTEHLERVIDTFQPDVVHCHWLPMAGPVSEFAARRGIPVTVRGHGFEFSQQSLADCAALTPVKSIYLFPHFAAAAAGGSGGGKIRPVPSCFNKARFYPRINQNRRMVLRAAACLDSKDIEAFIRVAARCPNHHFVLAMARIANMPDLPAQFAALNVSLGNPVDIRMDVANDAMAALTGEAGIYLHTFGFKQPFGMPVSIAEALACGAVLLIRDCPAARRYAGTHAFYYNTEDAASAYISATSAWPDEKWAEHAKANADFAYETYADDKVLGEILRNWQDLCTIQGAGLTVEGVAKVDR